MSYSHYPQAKTGKVIVAYEQEFTPGTTAYTAADAFQVVQVIPLSVYEANYYAKIKAIIINEYCSSGDTVNSPAIDFYFSETSFAGVADNAAFSFDSADATSYKECIRKLSAGAAYVAVASTNKVNVSYTPIYDANETIVNPIISDLYFQMVLPAGETFNASTKINIKILLELL